MCEKEREREKERKKERERKRERERERERERDLQMIQFIVFNPFNKHSIHCSCDFISP